MLRLTGIRGQSRLSLTATVSRALRPFVTASSVRSERSKSEELPQVAPLGIPYDKLTVGVPKETLDLEKRVAATPESVARLLKAGISAVQVERGAGAKAYFSDQAYEQVGAKIVDNVWKDSDIVLKVSRLCVLVVFWNAVGLKIVWM